MPIREYIAADPSGGCAHCREGFEQLEKVDAPPRSTCPRCGQPVRRKLSAPRVGPSKSGFDDRAKRAGFHKLKRIGRGEYEKLY